MKNSFHCMVIVFVNIQHKGIKENWEKYIFIHLNLLERLDSNIDSKSSNNTYLNIIEILWCLNRFDDFEPMLLQELPFFVFHLLKWPFKKIWLEILLPVFQLNFIKMFCCLLKLLKQCFAFFLFLFLIVCLKKQSCSRMLKPV